MRATFRNELVGSFVVKTAHQLIFGKVSVVCCEWAPWPADSRRPKRSSAAQVAHTGLGHGPQFTVQELQYQPVLRGVCTLEGAKPSQTKLPALVQSMVHSAIAAVVAVQQVQLQRAHWWRAKPSLTNPNPALQWLQAWSKRGPHANTQLSSTENNCFILLRSESCNLCKTIQNVFYYHRVSPVSKKPKYWVAEMTGFCI